MLNSDDILAEIRSRPGYMEKHARREAARNANIEKFKILSGPVLEELKNAGLDFPSFDALRESGVKYSRAVPILIQWLDRIDDVDVKESMVRALSVPWARPVAAEPLIREFRKSSRTAGNLRWAIANALTIVADDSVFNEIVELLRDKENGDSRQMLVLSLGSMKSPEAIQVLIGGLEDDRICSQALLALRKVATEVCRPAIRRMTNNSNPRISRAASEILTILDRKRDGK